MVDSHITKRTSAAPHPAGFDSFADWVLAATGQHGDKVKLATAARVTPQAVQKWQGKDVPKPATLRLVASWARVDYEDLLRLADRSRGGPDTSSDPRPMTFEMHWGFTLEDWLRVPVEVRMPVEAAITSAVERAEKLPAPRGRRALYKARGQ